MQRDAGEVERGEQVGVAELGGERDAEEVEDPDRAVLVAVGWSAAGSALCFAIAAKAIGLRVTRDEEREGLDLADHGERAYNP